MPTPMAYKALDLKYNYFAGDNSGGTKSLVPFIERLKSGDVREFASEMYNVFEPVTLPSCPSTVTIKDIIMGSGAEGALMSGSGPSVYGIFSDKASAESARDALVKLGIKAYATTTV